MKRSYKAWAGLALAIGIATTGAAGAESLAGLGVQYKFISPAQFVAHDPGCANGDTVAIVANCPGKTGTASYNAAMDLPEGAKVTNIYAWYSDSSTTNSVSIRGVIVARELVTYTTNWGGEGLIPGLLFDSGGATASSYLKIATLTPQGSLIISSWDTSHVGTNYNRYQAYGIRVNLPMNDIGVGFQGALIEYQRQLAPAPATADFTDVPTSHPLFNEVEQLKKSGITLGCGNGQFCPDSPVTRGQMAAFLARAFGLQWNPPA